LNKQVEDSWPW